MHTVQMVFGLITPTQLLLLLLALGTACAFEFINGFHDTANAVATVIYTKSLRPWQAVTISGVCNFLGVFLGGTAVAMGIIKLLPPELLATHNLGVSLAMVFALLFAAIIWNLGTWFLGLPASSSHTLIGAILGIGLANAYFSGVPLAQGVNWGKAGDIGLALLISPLLGFTVSALLLKLAKRLMKNPIFHQAPIDGKSPPWAVRSTLILTSSGVSLAHGSNDGQKGVGLVMVILLAIVPGHFALQPGQNAETIARTVEASRHLLKTLSSPELLSEIEKNQPPKIPAIISAANAAEAVVQNAGTAQLNQISKNLDTVVSKLDGQNSLETLDDKSRSEVRTAILNTDQGMAKLERSVSRLAKTGVWASVQHDRKLLKNMTDYAPQWVVVMIALSLGLGTMIGWKRIVVTLGERIGKSHLTYAQGASAELVAMSTIGISALAGLPVSTTHVLSSGIAGTMVANRSGLRGSMVRNILLAWVLTMPVSMMLSAALFLVFRSALQ